MGKSLKVYEHVYRSGISGNLHLPLFAYSYFFEMWLRKYFYLLICVYLAAPGLWPWGLCGCMWDL